MKIDGSVLEEKSSFKMLGLTFSSKLDWGSCIISIAKSASEKMRKTWSDKCLKTTVSEVNSQHATESQTLIKFSRRDFYQIFLSLRGKWSSKISLLVISKILGLVFNTLTTDYKYSVRNSVNLL